MLRQIDCTQTLYRAYSIVHTDILRKIEYCQLDGGYAYAYNQHNNTQKYNPFCIPFTAWQ